MPIATVAIDLAKTVFELAAADENGKIVERRRLSRTQLERYFQSRGSVHVLMEACGTFHRWARVFAQRDLRVSLLPPHYVRAATFATAARRSGLSLSFAPAPPALAPTADT